MKKVKLVWVDNEHIYFWEPHFEHMKKSGRWEITKVVTLKEYEKLMNTCADQDVVVIHGANVFLVQEIKRQYPNIKIGIQANVRKPNLEGLVDFYITNPLDRKKLETVILRETGFVLE